MKETPKGRTVLTMFVLTNIVYVFMLTLTIPGVIKFTGGKEIFDMLPGGYSYTYAAELLEKLGNEGREYYLYRQIPADMIYPGLFAISYALIIAYFLGKTGKLNTKLKYLSYLPIAAGLFDYLENICIIIMIKSFPDLSRSTVTAGNIFSVSKSVSTTISFTVIIVLLIIFAAVKIKRRPDRSSLQ
jgi:hypothetical protein